MWEKDSWIHRETGKMEHANPQDLKAWRQFKMTNFNTKQMIGDYVTVETKKTGVKYEGFVLEYFERNECVVLKNWKEFFRKKIRDSGEIIVLKRGAWIVIKKHYKGEKK